MTVLVLTEPGDVTADLVIARLDAMGAAVLRLDPADFPRAMALAAEYANGRVTGRIETAHHHVDLDALRSVWIRRPGAPVAPTSEQAAWVTLECERALYGVLRSLDGVRWMNHPDAVARSAYKPWQLAVAQRCGLDVPRTVFTNDPAAADKFAGRGPAVVKSVSGRHPEDPPITLRTTLVPVDADYAGVAGTATCLQDAVDKVFDVRVTVIGEQVLACRIDGEALDWRFADQDRLGWSPVQPPGPVHTGVLAYMSAAGLAFGAFDFAVDADRWWFLECNQGGQFGFAEIRAGLPIAQAVADWLAPGGPHRVPETGGPAAP
ncbi:MvdC/MvdD family ATP grasp protein [Streptacidiphilus sp. EB129]|uniref:MvdC/MvdD family ATP grasp protein n=1 Tax=Streptacidiphilus sp. EB129 TaxID=3156262 RepID=UPI003515F84F